MVTNKYTHFVPYKKMSGAIIAVQSPVFAVAAALLVVTTDLPLGPDEIRVARSFS